MVGLVVAACAWSALQRWVMAMSETVTVVVPKRDLEAYSVIRASDLVFKDVPSTVVDGFVVRKADEAAGKIATAPLYAGKLIDRRVLAEPFQGIGRWQVVGVNVSAARCAGVRAGDIVDVYWLRPEQGAWAPSQASLLVARDARVLKVCDERGQEIGDSPPVVQQAVGAVAPAGREPRVVYLLVRPEDVPCVIGGAAEKSAFIALARKLAPGNSTGTEVRSGAEAAEAGAEAGARSATAARGEPAGGR